MTYLEHVTSYFIALVGRGVSLSSRDLSLLQRWEAQGVPAAAVCRTLRASFERRRHHRGAFCIADCETDVERLSRRPTPGQTTTRALRWTPSLLLDRLEEVGRDAPEGPLREAYRALYREVRDLPEAELTVDQVAELDARAVQALDGSIDRESRRECRALARRAARELLGRGTDPEAGSRLRASLLERLYCDRYDLRVPSALLSGERCS